MQCKHCTRGGWNGGKGPSWSVQKSFNSGKGEKGANRAGKGQWSKTGGRRGKGQEKGSEVDIRVCWNCGKNEHIAANCTKESWNKSVNAVEEDKGEISEEVPEDEDELHVWCLLEESENEQWQEVTTKKKKKKKKLNKLHNQSLPNVENKSGVPPRKVVELKDTGAGGHVMLAEMFPRVKLDRTSTTKKIVAANRERMKDLGEKAIPFKSVEGVRKCIKFRSATVVKPLVSIRKVVQAGNVVVLDEKNLHIRNNRDGIVIKLDVNSGVCTMDMWVCLDETCPVFSWQRGGEESHAEQEMNGLEEGEDAMTDTEGEAVEQEGEAGSADWRVRASPRNKPTAMERAVHEATHTHAVPRLVPTLHDWQRSYSSPRVEEKKCGLVDETNNSHGHLLKPKTTANSQTIPGESVTCIAVKEDRPQNIMSSVVFEEENRRTLGKRESGKIHQLGGVQ